MRYSLTTHTARVPAPAAGDGAAASLILQVSQGQGGAAPAAQIAPAPAPLPQLPEDVVVPIPEPPAVMTRQYIEALEHAREQINDQLSNVQARRDRIAADLRAAEPAERPGLQERLEVLDGRLANFERQLAKTGEQLASPEAAMLATTTSAPAAPTDGLTTEQVTGITIVFIILVLFPLALAAARLMWKRATAPRPKPNPADTERLERLEHAVDTIAIEIERVAEGQRYVTKLLSAEAAAMAVAVQEESLDSRRAGSGSSSD